MTGIAELGTAYHVSGENAACERFLRRVLREYMRYFNHDRPHRGLAQRIPEAPEGGVPLPLTGGRVQPIPILGGLNHAYTRAA